VAVRAQPERRRHQQLTPVPEGQHRKAGTPRRLFSFQGWRRAAREASTHRVGPHGTCGRGQVPILADEMRPPDRSNDGTQQQSGTAPRIHPSRICRQKVAISRRNWASVFRPVIRTQRGGAAAGCAVLIGVNVSLTVGGALAQCTVSGVGIPSWRAIAAAMASSPGVGLEPTTQRFNRRADAANSLWRRLGGFTRSRAELAPSTCRTVQFLTPRTGES
jgi:hypothetical protein